MSGARAPETAVSEAAPSTPGAYLKARRCADRLSVEDVAQRLATMPRVGVVDRAEWIRLIEADAMPATFSTIVALQRVFAFDIHVLAQLDAIHQGIMAPQFAPRVCVYCGTTPGDVLPLGMTWAGRATCPVCIAFPDARPTGGAEA